MEDLLCSNNLRRGIVYRAGHFASDPYPESQRPKQFARWLHLRLFLSRLVSNKKPDSNPTTPSSSKTHFKILNDTSLAAISFPDGSRHVVFQDINGFLRRGTFNPVTKTWTFQLDPLSTQVGPRYYTPLAIVPGAFLDFLLFYVDAHNQLASIQVSPFSNEGGKCILNESFLVSPKARRLSASKISVASEEFATVLFYEDIEGTITALQLNYKRLEYGLTMSGQNITTALSTFLSSGGISIATISSSIAADASLTAAFFYSLETLSDQTKPSFTRMRLSNLILGTDHHHSCPRCIPEVDSLTYVVF